MKRFKFRLQRVLDYRERIRDEKLEILQRKNYERDQAIQHFENLREEQLRAGLKDEVCTAAELMLLAEYRVRLAAEIEAQIIKVKDAEAAAELARLDYVEASKDAKALDTLKEKRRLQHQEEVLKDEINQVEELTIQRIGRKAL